MMHAKRTVAGLLAFLASWPSAASAQQSVEDFYRGRKIDLIIGYSPGGTYDLYARLVARHLSNHIPGAPRRVHARRAPLSAAACPGHNHQFQPIGLQKISTAGPFTRLGFMLICAPGTL